LLEDDHDVDWEVGQDEPTGVDHPHRPALRGRAISDRLARRRPGQLAARQQVCVSPVGSAPAAAGVLRAGAQTLTRGRHLCGARCSAARGTACH
jgi:hypothetical protein